VAQAGIVVFALGLASPVLVVGRRQEHWLSVSGVRWYISGLEMCLAPAGPHPPPGQQRT